MKNLKVKWRGIFSVFVSILTIGLLLYQLIIGCSTQPNNICFMPYEPSGIQVLAVFFSLPIWFILSFCQYRSINKWSFLPLLYGLIYSLLLTFLDFLGRGSRLNWTYYGIIVLTISFVLIEIIVALFRLRIIQQDEAVKSGQ